DPGFPSRFSVTLVYPFVFLPPVTFQAVVATPMGLAISNAVSIMPGMNPGEASLVPALVPSSASPALDDGQALFVPTPPAFAFCGVPVPFSDVAPNGFLDFCPGAATGGGADFGSVSDAAGCVPLSPLARPRINVNHYDLDLTVAPPAPSIADITVEMA